VVDVEPWEQTLENPVDGFCKQVEEEWAVAKPKGRQHSAYVEPCHRKAGRCWLSLATGTTRKASLISRLIMEQPGPALTTWL